MKTAKYLPSVAEIREAYETECETSPAEFPPAGECSRCRGTGFEVRHTHAGRVAVPCECMDSEARDRYEQELNQNKYHSSRRFSHEDRREFRSAAPAPRELPAWARPRPAKPKQLTAGELEPL